jgi:type IV pilus assembly protein PilE
MKATRKAFTLIELIIVIVILGILAGIAYVSYATFVDNSKDTAVEQTAESLARQVKALSAFDQGGAPQPWVNYVAESMSDINTATVSVFAADQTIDGTSMTAVGVVGTVPTGAEASTAFIVEQNGRSACMVFPTTDASPTALVTVETGPTGNATFVTTDTATCTPT